MLPIRTAVSTNPAAAPAVTAPRSRFMGQQIRPSTTSPISPALQVARVEQVSAAQPIRPGSMASAAHTVTAL